jgi:hypothetical protein
LGAVNNLKLRLGLLFPLPGALARRAAPRAEKRAVESPRVSYTLSRLDA